MAFSEPPPPPPAPNVTLIDTKTGLPTQALTDYWARLTAWLKRLAAAV